MYRNYFKRFFDFLFSLIALCIFAPFLLLIIILLYFSNKGAGVFFFQPRPGKNGKVFNVIKFKSMDDSKDEEGNLLSDNLRLTKIGWFLRKTSIDELPQLINVLKGNMSIIGPRPLLVRYLPLYTQEQGRRHEVRPGITGWAQVHGRNFLLFSKRFEYDVWYVDHLCFLLDLKILMKSVIKVLARKDVAGGSSALSNADDLGFTK